MRFETAFDVAAEAQRAFEYISDARNEARWNPWAISVDKVGDGPIGEGTRFRGRYRRVGKADQWLSEYRPPHHVVYQSDKMDGRMTFDLQGMGPGRTRVGLVAEATPTGVMALFAPLMRPMMRSHIDDLAKGITRELGSPQAEQGGETA
jgi:carbon monoxide dehydrogenase subunit G